MGVKFGEIDANQILRNEFRITVLEEILRWIIEKNQTLSLPTQENIEKIKRFVISNLQEKYPKSGIDYKGR